jgi:hypothetical protein
MNALTAKAALDAAFFEARSKLLDLAAILDRIDRGDGDVDSDPRLALIREATEALLGDGPGRADRIQRIFSLPYDATWERPKPRV